MAHRNDDNRDDDGAWGARDFAPEQDRDAPRHGRYERNDYRPGSGDWRGPTDRIARAGEGGERRGPGDDGGRRQDSGHGGRSDYRDEPRYYRGVDFGGFHGHDDEHAMASLDDRERGHGGRGPDAGRGRHAGGSSGDWSGYGHGHPGAGGRGFAGRGPKGYVRSDERITEDVCEHLTHDPLVDASEIEVKVAQGTVTLEGTVGDRRMKHRAEDIAGSCSGVRDVDNRVRVRQKMTGGTTD